MKLWKLNYWKTKKEGDAFLSIIGEPNEVRIGANKKAFISIREESITISPNGKINIQSMPGGVTYAGIFSPPPFPLNLIPSTLATPIPQVIVTPPFVDLLPTLLQLTKAASLMVA
jgi:hypothetical protein